MPLPKGRAGFLAAAVAAGASAALSAVFIERSRSLVEGRRMFTLFDDAMVSMRYAANLAHGHGLVWNPHGSAVEGYTNFLWTLWMALLHAVGLSGSSAALGIMVTGALLLIGTTLCTGALTRALSDAPVSLVAMLLTASCYPLVFWTLRGMEVGLLAFAVCLGVLLSLRVAADAGRRSLVLLCVVVATMALTRDDAALFGLLFAAWLALMPATRRAAAVVATVVVATVGGHVLLRLALYGDALPNTYYLKLGGIPLSERLDRGFSTLGDSSAKILLPLVLAAVALVARPRAWRARGLLAATVALSLAYSTYVGGDAWEWFDYPNRYVSTTLPLLFVLAACGVGEVLRAVAAVVPRNPRLTLPIVALAGIATLAGSTDWHAYGHWAGHNALSLDQDAEYTKIGVLLDRATPQDATIAVVTAGAIAYYAHRQAIDILGKNDTHVAHLQPRGPLYPGHNKWDYDYSIAKLEPDVVVQLWADPPSSDQMQQWGYVQVGYLWVRQGGRVLPTSVEGLYP